MSSPLAATEFTRILLIKPSALGDVVHAVPVLVELRKRYPSARIDWLVTPENAELVRHHPALSGIVLFDRRAFRQGWRALLGLPRFWRQLRQPRYDLVIDLHGQLRSAGFALATGSSVRIGFDRPRRRTSSGPRRGWAGAREGAWLAYTHRIPIPTLQVHAVDRYLWLGALLGWATSAPEQTLYLDPASHTVAERLLAACGLKQKPFALLSPATMWETKHWRRGGFAEVATALGRQGRGVILVGGPGERALCEQIRQQSPEVHNLAGRTSAGALAALVQRAEVCVSNDSAVAHLAAACGRPLVALYGPTNPVTVGPYQRPQSVVRLDLPCSPCNYRRLIQCPHRHACMEQLPVERVLERLVQERG